MLSRFWNASRRVKIAAGVGAGITTLTALALVLALVLPRGVFADVLIAGDTLLPPTVTSLNFGTVCAGSTTNKTVALAINATGHSGSLNNVYANGAVVTVTATSVTGSGLSADGGAPYPRTVGTITMPSNWTSQPNQNHSASVTSHVTLVAGALGALSGTVSYASNGAQVGGGTLTRQDSLTVTANVVTCHDNLPPVLSLPSNMTVEATGPSGAIVTYSASASDDAPASPAVTCSPASGSTFPLGTTTVNCSSTDADGNTSTGHFTVKVQDTTAPAIANGPTDITAEATGPSGASVTYTAPTATDLVDGPVPVNCAPPSGGTYPLGVTTVNCTATDAHGNTATASFTVTVKDTTAPVLTLPADITAEATGPSGAVVTYTASAFDLVDGSVPVSCDQPSGSTFPIGATTNTTTTVNCTASDNSGNTVSGSFTVTVQDTTPPDLTLPADITAEATGPNGAAVSYSASATDLVDGAVTPVCSPASGSTFPIGATTNTTTTVNCTATDAHGNTASGSFTVTIQDTTPPDLTLPADMAIPATSSSGAVATFTATATDLVDGDVTPVCTPASGSLFPIGITTVNCVATDAHGNQSMGSFTVRVTYQVNGFFDPVTPSPYAPTNITWNTIKGGQSVPLKFQVFAGSDQITSTSVIQQPLSLTRLTCQAGTLDAVDITSTGATSLRYDTTGGQFIYNWQTPKQPGACYLVTVYVLDGSSSVPGTSIQAFFQLK